MLELDKTPNPSREGRKKKYLLRFSVNAAMIKTYALMINPIKTLAKVQIFSGMAKVRGEWEDGGRMVGGGGELLRSCGRV